MPQDDGLPKLGGLGVIFGVHMAAAWNFPYVLCTLRLKS